MDQNIPHSGYDFDTIIDDILLGLHKKYGADFNDAVLSSPMIMLMELVSSALDQMSFMLDRRAGDCFSPTARTRKAIERITRQLGYKIRPAVAASVDLEVAVAEPVAFAVPIPQGFQFQGPNDLIFEAGQQITFAPNSGPTDIKIIPCYQGQTFSESFVSDGTGKQTFSLRKVPDDSFLVNGSVKVQVNGVYWSESDFITYDATDQFEVGYATDPQTIKFGDGNAGNIPPSQSTITVTYIVSRGRVGQVANGTITDVVKPLKVNFQTITLSINNPAPAIAGDDIEDLDHIKAFSGLVYKARDVAVTRQDFESLAGAFADPLYGKVASAQAISARSSDQDLYLKGQLGVIATQVGAPFALTQNRAADALARLTTIATALVAIQGALDAISAGNLDVDNHLVSMLSYLRDAKNHYTEIDAAAATINSLVVTTQTAVTGYAVAGSTQMTANDKDALLSYLSRIQSKVSAQQTEAVSANGSITAGVSTMGYIRDQLALLGLNQVTPDTQLLTAKTNLDTITTNIGNNTPTAIRKDVIDIQAAIVAQNAAIQDALTAIDEHVDGILAADCKSNLVVVPILALDGAGFYAAPSVGLMKTLQAYLEARKEITQTVKVTSGADSLVPAVLTIRLGIKVGVGESTSKAAADAIADSVLRGRRFGLSLYASDFDGLDKIDGFVFKNVKLNGHRNLAGNLDISKLDADGNLIISSSEVITKGTVTITVETVTR